MKLPRAMIFSLALIVLVCGGMTAVAQPSQQQAPKILKIDPPNWWARMPKPMLLIRGENLNSAKLGLSDPHLKIQRSSISANGHWAEVWLNASPAAAETVNISIKTAAGTASAPYRFEKRRASSDGFSGFSSSNVMYLIMIDRFADGDPANDGTPAEHNAELARPRGWHGGDLRGIEQHIDYMQDLGVDTVWITPVYQNLGEDHYHGYGATDMYSVDEHFGSMKDLQELANALHRHHMKLVLDTVPNHVHSLHPWVGDTPEPDWFHGTPEHHTKAQGNFAPLTDPHAPWRDRRKVTEGWFTDYLPDLNQENPAVSRYLIQNALWWTEEAGLDGLRIDTFPYVGRQFWHDFHAEIHSVYPHLTTVGEVANGDATITSSFAGGVTRNGVDTGLDTPFDFPVYFAIRETLLNGAPMTKLADTLRLDALYPHPERLVPFIGNHDTSRFLNDPTATPQMLKLAFTLITTMRGMPELYAGDEIAMRGGDDPDNRRDFPGGFRDSPTSASQADAFDARTRSSEQRETFDAVKKLLTIRSSHAALQTGDEQIVHADENTLVYVRAIKTDKGFTERVLVAVNKGKEPRRLEIDTEDTSLKGGTTADILIGEPMNLHFSSAGLELLIPGGSAIVAAVAP